MSFYSNSSYSPFKVNSNVLTNGTPPIFENVNSFSFDGVDEYFLGTSTYSELNGLQKATWSIWVKPINTGVDIIFHNPRNTTSQNSQFLLWIYEGARIDFSLETTAKYIRGDINAITFGAWNHIMVCVDYTQSLNADKGRIFVNGVDATTSLNLGSNPQIFETATRQLFIGEDANGYQSPYGGKLDEFSIWAGTDQRANVSEIYGGGQAVDLNNLATAPQPTTWFRMGDLASWNGATWTMTDVNGSYTNRSINMVEANRTTDVPPTFSTRSIALDGVDDYVEIGSPTSIQSLTSAITISFWIKAPRVFSTNYYTPLSKGEYAASGSQWSIKINTANARNTVGGTFTTFSDANAISGRQNLNFITPIDDNQWHHMMFVNDGTDLKIYLDGQLEAIGVGQGSTLYDGNRSLKLGRLTSTSSTGLLQGNLDEVSIFSTALGLSDAQSIYNSGVPNDITSLNPLSWWRCGDGDTAPTLTDNGSGGNNGTMTNFTTFSTDVPT